MEPLSEEHNVNDTVSKKHNERDHVFFLAVAASLCFIVLMVVYVNSFRADFDTTQQTVIAPAPVVPPEGLGGSSMQAPFEGNVLEGYVMKSITSTRESGNWFTLTVTTAETGKRAEYRFFADERIDGFSLIQGAGERVRVSFAEEPSETEYVWVEKVISIPAL